MKRNLKIRYLVFIAVLSLMSILAFPSVTSAKETITPGGIYDDGTVTATPAAEETPEATPSATSTPDPNVIIVIEGPVINIVTNIITVYDFDIEVEPTNPMLNIIDIGTFVHIEGSFGGSGIIVASVVTNISSVTTIATGATAGLDGPVEAINGNIVTINGIPVQFHPNDPRLKTLHVGDFLNVQGNFEGSGATIVLVVVNVTIINNVIVSGNPLCYLHVDGMGMGHWRCDGCWFHVDGMGMGHWHCNDGMGMGMGMGDAMGMGMGE